MTPSRRESLIGATSLALGASLGGRAALAATSSASVNGVINVFSFAGGNSAPVIIKPGFVGLSFEKFALADGLFSTRNANLSALISTFKFMGSSYLRIGGNTVDTVKWNQNGNGTGYNEVAPANIAQLRAFLDRVGWQVIYGVNLATSTPDLAVAEVNCVVQTLGDRLYAVEFGNEPNFFNNQKYPPPTGYSSWTYALYINRWKQFADAVLHAQPNIRLAGPEFIGDLGWFKQFLADTQSYPLSLATFHYYRGSGTQPSDNMTTLLSPDSNHASQVAAASQLAASRPYGLPLRMAEVGSYLSPPKSGSNGGNTYSGALWAIDHVFQSAIHGASGVNFHCVSTANYTAIENKWERTTTGLRPAFWGLVFAAKTQYYVNNHSTANVVQNSIIMTGKANPYFSAYAIRADSDCGVVIVNKDPSTTLNMTVNFNSNIDYATLIQMGGPALTASTPPPIWQASFSRTQFHAMPTKPQDVGISGTQASLIVPPASATYLGVTCQHAV